MDWFWINELVNSRTHAGARVGCMGRRSGHKEGVHIVHTLGCGLGRTTTGLGRIVDVLGSSQCLQGLERSSSPTSGTCFRRSGGLRGL